MRTIAFIPARGGSKGLPGKNTKHFGEKPLYQHSVAQALEANIGQIFISTDIQSILEDQHPSSVDVIARPAHLAGDKAEMQSVLLHFFDEIFTEPATVILLQPTSPLRQSHHIKDALAAFEKTKPGLLMSVCQAPASYLKAGTLENERFQAMRNNADCFANRQSLPPVYRPNGAIYIFDADKFRTSRALPSGDIAPLIMDAESSLDIDTQSDFERCEKIFERRNQDL